MVGPTMRRSRPLGLCAAIRPKGSRGAHNCPRCSEAIRATGCGGRSEVVRSGHRSAGGSTLGRAQPCDLVATLTRLLVLDRDDLQPEPLLQCARHETSDAVRLPASRSLHLLDRSAVAAPQQRDHDVLLRQLAGGRLSRAGRASSGASAPSLSSRSMPMAARPAAVTIKAILPTASSSRQTASSGPAGVSASRPETMSALTVLVTACGGARRLSGKGRAR